MSSYLYILIKYFIIIIVLVLIFKYTNLFTIDNSTIFLLLFLMLISIIIDIILSPREFTLNPPQSCNTKETFNSQNMEKIVDKTQIRNNNDITIQAHKGNTLDQQHKDHKVESVEHIKPNKILEIDDDTFFDNYKPDYYEEGLENDNVHQNKYTKNIDGGYSNIYNMYMENCYKASLE